MFVVGVAHPARVYNYWLGGEDHYEADRVVGDEVARCRPHVVARARANRAFLARAVRYLAGDCGVRHLPLWDHLPTWAFWLLPTTIGAPIVARSITRARRAGQASRPLLRG